MPSLQSYVVRTFCRIAIKRPIARSSGSPEQRVATARRVFELADSRNVRYTRGLRVVPASYGGVRGEWILPHEPRDRALLYVHGGGYVACSPLTYRRFTTAFAREADLPVFAVDYRRAPEHPFPAALEDVVAAYDALRARLLPAGIVIAGDSAGGALALSAVLALRARGERVLPAAVVAFSPWTDLLATGTSIVENARSDDMLVGSGIAASGMLYAQHTERRNPLLSPLYGELNDLPPTLVFASSSEVLRDDAARFVDRARSAGSPVELVLEAHMPHVWPIFYDYLPEARRSLVAAVAFLQRQLAVAGKETVYQ